MEQHRVSFTYLNIRQSIAIMLAKLIFADFVFAAIIIGLYFILVRGEVVFDYSFASPPLFLLLFGVIGFFKILLSIYIVLLWLNEYYEITPESVVHKTGVIFRKSQLYDLDKIRVMEVQDTFLGEILNYATITLYDIRLNKYLDMYLIHNPKRYANVIKELRPDIEIKEDSIKLPFMPKKSLIKEYE